MSAAQRAGLLRLPAERDSGGTTQYNRLKQGDASVRPWATTRNLTIRSAATCSPPSPRAPAWACTRRPSTSPGCPGGEYSTHGLGIEPDAYDPKLDVDFTLLRKGGLNVVGLDRAA